MTEVQPQIMTYFIKHDFIGISQFDFQEKIKKDKYRSTSMLSLLVVTFSSRQILTIWNSVFSFYLVSLCAFIMPVRRQAMLLQCENMYAGTGHLNTKNNMKYNYFCLGSLRNTFSRCTKANHDLTTQLSIIIIGLMSPNCACNV